MPRSFHPPLRRAAPGPVPSMFLVFQWRPGVLPPPRPAQPRPVLPPAPQRRAGALAAIDAVRGGGTDRLADIARILNERGVPTLSGRGSWHGAQVARAEGKRTG